MHYKIRHYIYILRGKVCSLSFGFVLLLNEECGINHILIICEFVLNFPLINLYFISFSCHPFLFSSFFKKMHWCVTYIGVSRHLSQLRQHEFSTIQALSSRQWNSPSVVWWCFCFFPINSLLGTLQESPAVAIRARSIHFWCTLSSNTPLTRGQESQGVFCA